MNILAMTRKQEKRCSLEQKREFFLRGGGLHPPSPRKRRQHGGFNLTEDLKDSCPSISAALRLPPRRHRKKAKARIRFQIHALHFLAVSERLNFPPGRFNHSGTRRGRGNISIFREDVNNKLWFIYSFFKASQEQPSAPRNQEDPWGVPLRRRNGRRRPCRSRRRNASARRP